MNRKMIGRYFPVFDGVIDNCITHIECTGTADPIDAISLPGVCLEPIESSLVLGSNGMQGSIGIKYDRFLAVLISE